MINNLTLKQQLVLKAVHAYWKSNQVPPSISALAQHVGISKATAYEHLLALKKKGHLEHIEGVARTWRPTKSQPQLDSFSIPLLGLVAAGNPILATENIEDFIEYKPPHPHEAYFALRIKGDSMIEAHILPHDIVIVRKQSTAKNGDIVIALIDNEEATVKEFKLQQKQIALLPKNINYHPILLDSNRVQILGKVVEVRRTLSQ